MRLFAWLPRGADHMARGAQTCAEFEVAGHDVRHLEGPEATLELPALDLTIPLADLYA